MKNVINTIKNADVTEANLNVATGITVVTDDLLDVVSGARIGDGWFRTISGECNRSGRSCNPFPWN